MNEQTIVTVVKNLSEPPMDGIQKYLDSGWVIKSLSTTSIKENIAVTLLLEKEKK